MRLTASRPFLPWPMREISGKAFKRKASSSRAGFSSSTMMVLMGIGVKGKYSAEWRGLDSSDQGAVGGRNRDGMERIRISAAPPALVPGARSGGQYLDR